MFSRYIGIDYSGAETPESSLKGLQVASVVHDSYVRLVPPPPSPRKYWTREAIANWLVETLSEGPPTIVGIDHGFSFPIAYYQKYKLARDWSAFLADFCRHWPTDRRHTYVDFVRDDQRRGVIPERVGHRRWRRLTELCAGSAKSVFHFDVTGGVAKSTHAGIPWLRHIREHVRRPAHFWPFDDWGIPDGHSAIVEVYPRLWRLAMPRPHGLTEHELDAHIIARTLCDADVDGRLERWLLPELTDSAKADVRVEGWILGADASKLSAGAAADRTQSSRQQRLSPSAFLSRFFGITVAMYPPFDGPPRVHASNQRGGSTFDVQTACAVDGNLQPVAAGLVTQWIDRFKDALFENWSRGRSGLPLYKIEPLE